MADRILFVDMNSFFASVEQQEIPALRSRPIIVAPLIADTTCAIAASYEAKAFGIRTGTRVREARRLCPDLQIVPARPRLYREYHARIVEILNAHFVEVKPLSVDEMACRVSPYYAGREAEIQMARRVKEDLYRRLGAWMRCSIGIAPNVFLAKVATDLEKPDGLVALDESNLPQALFALQLIDLPGIGRKMHAHLLKYGIYSVRDLYAASPWDLRRAWGGVDGERWWHMLRGSRATDYEANVRVQRKTVGHSHVLPPAFRSESGVKQILLRLLSKGLKRLRGYRLAAGALNLHVRYYHETRFTKRNWDCHVRLPSPVNDDMTWYRRARERLDSMPAPEPGFRPLRAGIVFSSLIDCEDANLSLFDSELKRRRACEAVDAINARFGHVVDLASVFWLRHQAPYRIAFGASMLDSETGEWSETGLRSGGGGESADGEVGADELRGEGDSVRHGGDSLELASAPGKRAAV